MSLHSVDIKSDLQLIKEGVTDALEGARSRGLVAVVIVGLEEDGRIYCQRSGFDSKMEFVGAIEYAKHRVIG